MPSVNLVTSVPGPKSQAIVARRESATARGAAKLTPIAIESAHGATVTDVDGNVLLDFAGGIGVLAVGHTPERVVEALKRQAEKLIHMCAIVSTYEPYVAMAEILNASAPITGNKKCVLLNSGAEAVETAVKIARSHTGRSGVIVFEGAYHGRTNLTLAMTSKYALFKKGFGPFAPEIYRLPFPNTYRIPDGMTEEDFVQYSITQLENAMIAQIDPAAIAAIVIEPVQGEGGFLPVPPRFMQKIRTICDDHGIVMVADEIQSGWGRTGTVFAIEHYDVEPDLITTAKSIAAGMPIAGVVGRAEIVDAPHPGGLGGTYSGNPLACVAGIETMQMINNTEFLERARNIGAKMRQHLEALKGEFNMIGDVRGLGAMLAIEIVKDRTTKEPDAERTSAINSATLKRGLITIRAGLYSNCVRFLPPLNITNEEIEEAMNILREAITEVSTN